MQRSSASSPAWPKGGWPRSCASDERLGEILVERQRARDRAGDLRHFETVGEPRAVVIALMLHEDLGLVLQPPERRRMDDAVAVALERRALALGGSGMSRPRDFAGSQA